MNNIIKRKWNQNSMVIIEDLQGMAFQAESGGHTFQISGIDGEGNTVALSGTPAGVMLRSDGQDVTLTCSVSGGVVFATLPANAYVVPGRFGLTIFLTSAGQKTAIYAAVGTVGKTSSGTVAPPAGSDVVDLVNAIAAAVATIPASYTDLMAGMAPTYSTSGLYAVGSYAWYSGKLYRCTTAITSGETFNPAHWTQTTLGGDLGETKSNLREITLDYSTFEEGLASTSYMDLGNKWPPFKRGYYSTVAVGSTSSYVSSDEYTYAITAVNPGDVVHAHAYGGSGNMRAWMFLDSARQVTRRSTENLNFKGTLTAETGERFVCVNNKLASLGSGFYAFVGEPMSGLPGEVDDLKSAFKTSIQSNSLFDPFSTFDNVAINGSGGLSTNSDFMTSDFIPVVAGVTYSGNFTNHCAFYTSDKSYIENSRTNLVFTVTAPSNASFARIDWNKGTISADKIVFVEGSGFPTETKALKLNDNAKIPTDQIMKATENLFCFPYIDGLSIGGDGGASANASFSMSDYIPVTAGTTYTGNFTNHCAFYKADKTYIANSRTNQVYTVTAPSNSAFARIDWNKSMISADEIMFVQGSSVPATYIPGKTPIYKIPVSKLVNNEEIQHLVDISGSLLVRTDNLFNKTTLEDNAYIAWDGSLKTGSTATNFSTSDFIPVVAGETYSGVFSNHCAFYYADKSFISGSMTNQVYTVTAPVNAAYARIDWDKRVMTADEIMFVHSEAVTVEYKPYYEPYYRIPARKVSDLDVFAKSWSGKNVLFYGDSITARINGDAPKSWSIPFSKELALGGIHGRGVGGQTFFWNTATFQVDANGNYVDRGTAADNCLGCFPSWQRISSMIPDAIKNNIDVIVIMGGTNDISNVEEQTGAGSIEWVRPLWSSNNTTDSDWVSATEYNGGDYDVSTFTGAIASTIMKMQARCPNAKIVLASPLSRWNMTYHIPYEKNNVTMQDMVDIQHKTANFMSVPFIDINALCGINGWNYTTYISDGVHPNSNGDKMLASAMLSGFEAIYPKIQ